MRQKKSRSFNFLVEMVISIFFFSIASIVCVQLFAQGVMRNNKAIRVTEATFIAQNAAEAIKGGYELDVVEEGYIRTVTNEGNIYTITVSDGEETLVEMSVYGGAYEQ
ncbi:MAG: hypothetical protein HUJ57_01855 [Erysipelotrichaceae bacterium]|nr:hypothetical protein [Erysipelotrichaceae bacterium]